MGNPGEGLKGHEPARLPSRLLARLPVCPIALPACLPACWARAVLVGQQSSAAWRLVSATHPAARPAYPPARQFIAAAGNEAVSTPSYPGAYNLPNVITVAALTSTGALASYSNRGTWCARPGAWMDGAQGRLRACRAPCTRPASCSQTGRMACCCAPAIQTAALAAPRARRVHLGAPGSSVKSTTPGNTYSIYSGTSMACPHVTGAAALYRAKYPAATAANVKTAILQSATYTPALAGSVTSSGGRLNAAGMLSIVPGVPPTCSCATNQYCVSGLCYTCPATW